MVARDGLGDAVHMKIKTMWYTDSESMILFNFVEDVCGKLEVKVQAGFSFYSRK